MMASRYHDCLSGTPGSVPAAGNDLFLDIAEGKPEVVRQPGPKTSPGRQRIPDS